VKPGKNPGDRMGQFRNLLLWLRPASNTPFFFQLPKTARAEIEEEIWFFRLEKTWLAIYPINLSAYTPVTIPNPKFSQLYRREQTLKAFTQGHSYAGFALEIGEQSSHGSYEHFKQAVKQKSQLDLSELINGNIKLQDAQGHTLQLIYNHPNLLPVIFRNGIKHDWSKHFALYNSLSKDNSPISLGWKQGELKIKAGELQFKTTVTKERREGVSP
jgi:hypothetical protein